MKKTRNLPASLRWSAFLILLVFMTGCAEWNFFRWLGGDPDAPEPPGCDGPFGRSYFDPVGYDAMMGPRRGGIYARDMGFAKDEPHFIPITRSSSSN